MEFGICDLSVVQIHAEPSDKSEIVSQILFGETYEVLLKKSPWIRIRMTFDGYEGWIDEKQHVPVSSKYYEKRKKEPPSIALDLVTGAVSPLRHIPIVIGSDLPFFDGMNFKIKKEKFVYNGQALMPDNHMNHSKIIEKCALKYLNTPYMWGGRSPFGIDCSGLTQMIFKLLGITLRRDSNQQAGIGSTIDMVHQAKEGDLAFFNNKEGKITHVGIVLKDGKIIHASGQVRIDKLDSYGIFNERKKKYTHPLKVIKRVL